MFTKSANQKWERFFLFILLLLLSLMLLPHSQKRTDSNPSTGKSRSASERRSVEERSEKGATPSGAARPVLSQNTTILQEKWTSYIQLKEKTLRTAEEMKSYTSVLRDREVIESSVQFLLKPDLKQEATPMQLQRIARVGFLIESLRLTDPSDRREILEGMERVVLGGKVDSQWPESVRRAWVGDRVELYMALLHYDSERADLMMQKSATDAATQKVLIFAKNFYHGQRSLGVKH